MQLDPEMKLNSIMIMVLILVHLLRKDTQWSVWSLSENTNLNSSFLPKQDRAGAYAGYKLVLDEQYYSNLL